MSDTGPKPYIDVSIERTTIDPDLFKEDGHATLTELEADIEQILIEKLREVYTGNDIEWLNIVDSDTKVHAEIRHL